MPMGRAKGDRSLNERYIRSRNPVGHRAPRNEGGLRYSLFKFQQMKNRLAEVSGPSDCPAYASMG